MSAYYLLRYMVYADLEINTLREVTLMLFQFLELPSAKNPLMQRGMSMVMVSQT